LHVSCRCYYAIKKWRRWIKCIITLQSILKMVWNMPKHRFKLMYLDYAFVFQKEK
jgi:hypothetical protein